MFRRGLTAHGRSSSDKDNVPFFKALMSGEVGIILMLGNWAQSF
jgi:hypothetical protein